MKKWLVRLVWGFLGLLLLLGVALFIAYLAASGRYVVAPTVAQDKALPHITLDGVTFHAESFGRPDAPVVIAIHGGPGNDYRYLLPLKPLSSQYRVVFYDQRGTGLSPRVPDQELTVDNMLADLHRIVLHYGKGKPVRLIGHSWGAMLASGYVGRHPQMVSHLVLAEPGLLTTEAARAFLQKFKFDLGLRGGAKLAWVWLQSRHVSGPDQWAKDDYFFRAISRVEVSGNPLRGYACGGRVASMWLPSWRFSFSSSMAIQGKHLRAGKDLHVDFVKGVGQYKGKTMFIAGECNQVIGASFQRRYHLKYFPGAQFHVMQGAGHTMFGEKPARSLVLLRRFLAGTGGATF